MSACRKGSPRRSASSPCSTSSPRSATGRTRRRLRVAGGEIRFEDVRFAYANRRRGAARRDASSCRRARRWRWSAPRARARARSSTSSRASTTSAAGAVPIDGADVRDVTLASLRAAIALVSQEVSLFDDTVRANIAYGRLRRQRGRDRRRGARRPPPTTSSARCRRATTPWSASTASSSRAASASASPSRAPCCKNAPILLLDEATSALDTESERQVQAALRR